jgi:hypothetical protein
MLRKSLALAVGLAILSLVATAQDKKKDGAKEPTIKEIMKKGHGSKGLLDSITAAAKGKKWEAAENDAKLLKEFGEGLGKLKPSKGGEESWAKLADKYKDNTAAVADAVDKKDAKAAADAVGAIKKSCGECHTAHKGK